MKIPHIGWNSLAFPNKGRLYEGIAEQSYVYFVHSYYLKAENSEVVAATTEYGVNIHASVEYENLYACQFQSQLTQGHLITTRTYTAGGWSEGSIWSYSLYPRPWSDYTENGPLHDLVG